MSWQQTLQDLADEFGKPQERTPSCLYCGRFVSYYREEYSNPNGDCNAEWFCSKCGWTGGVV